MNKRKLCFALSFTLILLIMFIIPVKASGPLIDSYNESNQDAGYSIAGVHPSADADRSSWGQGFLNAEEVDLGSCKFYLKKDGLPVGNLRGALYAHSGTFGSSSVPTGSILSESSDVPMADISDVAYELVEFVFSVPYTLSADTYYCINVYVHDATNIDAANNILVGCDQSAPSHDGNVESWASNTWTPWSGGDSIFYVYGTEGYSVTFYYNSGGQLEVESSLTANGTTNEYSVGKELTLKAYPDGSILFLNYTWNGNTNASNPYILTVSQNYTVWCYFQDFPEPSSRLGLAMVGIAIGLSALVFALKIHREGGYD